MKLSVALAVYNEEKILGQCLTSIKDIADEIVIVDGGSTDKTVTIARSFGARITRTDNPSIFHINKQKALDSSLGDWILQLDADEEATEDLKKEILHIIASSPSGINGYYIPRRNFFWGHWMRKGGLYPDYVIRLVKQGKAHFPCRSVHEQIAIDGKAGYCKEELLHYSYRTREDYWRKSDAYTALTAAEMKKRGISNSLKTWFTYTVMKPVQTFVNIFIRNKGFIDGWYGLIFAWWSALHFPIAYKKFRT